MIGRGDSPPTVVYDRRFPLTQPGQPVRHDGDHGLGCSSGCGVSGVRYLVSHRTIDVVADTAEDWHRRAGDRVRHNGMVKDGEIRL